MKSNKCVKCYKNGKKKKKSRFVTGVGILPLWGYHISILMSASNTRIFFTSISSIWECPIFKKQKRDNNNVQSWRLHITGLIHLCSSNPCFRVPARTVTTIDLVRVKIFKLQSFSRQVCIYGVAIQTVSQNSQIGGCVRII